MLNFAAVALYSPQSFAATLPVYVLLGKGNDAPRGLHAEVLDP